MTDHIDTAQEREWLDKLPRNNGTFLDLLRFAHEYLDALAAERAHAEKAVAEVERLRAVLNDIYENVEYWNTLRISSKIRAALKRPEASHDD